MESWPCRRAAVALVYPDGRRVTHGEVESQFEWASVTKLAAAVAALVAVEEGSIGLDEPAGPPGSTVRHLLAHASGLPFSGHAPIARPGERRVYSNEGFEVLASHVSERAGMAFADYFAAVWGFPLAGSPAHGVRAPLGALIEVALELQRPTRVSVAMLEQARSTQFAGLGGVLPGFGRCDPNDWGLGFELRDGKQPHWTGTRNSPATYGHFGRAGTFLWVDPAAGVALACLTDLDFGEWAKDAWPKLADAVLTELALKELIAK